MSLEDRLAELNASLPQGFKTSDERLQEINRGLNRLGLPSYYDSSPTKPKIEPPKSESQQVEDIIAQAKDEVRFEPKDEGSDAASTGTNSDHFLAHSDSDDDDDSLLSDDVAKLQNVTKIRDEVAAAQAKLAELIVLMDTLSSTEEEEENELDHEGTNASSAFDPACAKKTLKDAKASLQKALKLWKVKASS
jgi:hypothetical protein